MKQVGASLLFLAILSGCAQSKYLGPYEAWNWKWPHENYIQATGEMSECWRLSASTEQVVVGTALPLAMGIDDEERYKACMVEKGYRPLSEQEQQERWTQKPKGY